MKNINNNNNRNLIPFSLDSFSLSDFKAIILKYSHRPSDSINPFITKKALHILDCDEIPVGCIFFSLPYKGENDIDHHYCVNNFYDLLIETSKNWSKEFGHELFDPYLFYMKIVVS